MFAEAISENSSATAITQWTTAVLQLTPIRINWTAALGCHTHTFCTLCGVLVFAHSSLFWEKVQITGNMECRAVFFFMPDWSFPEGWESYFYIDEENIFFLSP